MDINREIKLAKEKVVEGYNYTGIVCFLAERKIYHTIALSIFQKVFDVESDFAKEYIYANKYYLSFKDERNPFNDEFLEAVEG